jgi:phosphoglycerate dehydrogenase-like enzyme
MTMRVHVQNAPNDPDFAVTPAMWQAAGGTEDVTFGDSELAFQQGVAQAEALVTSTAALSKFFPCPAPHLKLIYCTSAGLDRLAPFDWLPPHVSLVNNSGVHGPRVGEYAAMALLMLAGQLPALMTAQREGRWEKRYGSVLAGRRLAVIGTGDLGAAAGRAARMFGMHSVGVRTHAVPHPDFDATVAVADLDSVLPEVEFLVLAAPLTPRTRDMMDRHRLGLLPKGAGVINIGRGALLDQEALCDLLDSGHLGGAVLDVFVPEPIPPGHRLWTTKNLIITPHVAADDPKTYAKDSVDVFLKNLAAYEAGQEMPNLFDTARGY